MADLPRATTRIDDTAGPVGSGSKYCAIIAPVPTNADSVPRVYSNAASIYANHGYAQGVDYAAYHFKKTNLPVVFVPVPIATPGVVGRINQSGNTNTAVVSVAVGGSGSLEETDGVVVVSSGGVVGTDSIVLSLSLNGGRDFKTVKLGTATSYVIPYVGLTISIAAGSLTAGDTVLTWHSTAPMWDAAGIAAAKTALANQSKRVRDWFVLGELSTYDAQTQGLQTAVNAYETEDERYVCARVALRDRLPYAQLSKDRVNMTGNPSVTFADVGATGDTITRSSGSFIADGFVTGDTIRVTGSTSNNITGKVTNVAASVLTLDTATLSAEGPKSGVSITSEPTLTFAEIGGTGDTITRNRGSWLADGFRAGDTITVTGTVDNNVSGAVSTVTPTVLTMGSTDLAAETIGVYSATITAGETKAQHVATLDAAMAQVTSRRMNLGHGRARIMSPFLNQPMRRNVIWDDSVISYQHDLHIATFAKELGPTGSSLEDANGNLYEHDERVDGGALQAGFTCYRTWANGPDGAFIAMSLTRASDSSALSRQQNMNVANLAQSITQSAAEAAIGKSLVLNSDGTPTEASLVKIKNKVDSALKRGLLANVEGEGQRASDAYWTPDANVDLRVPGAVLPAVTTLNLNGTIEQISSVVKVNADV